MSDKLNPEALAEWGEEEGSPPEQVRDGVQPVDEHMILDYVLEKNFLPDYSAQPFSEWLNLNFFQYSEPSTVTNAVVVEAALHDWCGGRKQA